MQEKIEEQRVNELTESIVLKYLKKKKQSPDSMICVDIEGLASEYFKQRVIYEVFAEDDPGRDAFSANGIRPLKVRRNGKVEEIVFPPRTAVIEKFLLSPKESARKRFTIAHEGAHDVMGRHIPLQASPMAAFHSEYDPEMTYTGDMLKEMLSVNECFTNRAAACFLMPGFLVARVLKRHNNQKKVIVYDNGILSQDQKLLIQKMADTLGVSYTAFYHRLGELDLFDRRPIEEYLHSGLCYGGEAYAGSN